MKTPFYGVCDRGSSAEYFETFLSLVGAKLIEIKQFKITVNTLAGSHTEAILPVAISPSNKTNEQNRFICTEPLTLKQ